jgi:hypothetical protein
MSDRLLIIQPMRRNTIAQDAPGTIFSRGAATLVSPFSPTRILEVRFSRVNAIGKFRTVEDGVDAAVPVDAKNAPTSDLENCKSAVFHSVHTDHFSYKKKKKSTASVPI